MRFVRRIGRRAGRVAFFAQMAAGAGDGEAFVVEQALDAQHGVNVFAAIEAMALRALDGLEHGELGFPVAQHEGLGVRQAADFADAVKALADSGFDMAVSVHFFLSCAVPIPTPLLSYADSRACQCARGFRLGRSARSISRWLRSRTRWMKRIGEPVKSNSSRKRFSRKRSKLKCKRSRWLVNRINVGG